jgi:hypothetical protein
VLSDVRIGVGASSIANATRQWRESEGQVTA